MNKKIVIICVIVAIFVYFTIGNRNENFDTDLKQIAPKDGFYLINFSNGKPMNAVAFTTVGCKEFSLGSRVPRDQAGWILQQVVGSQGVFLIKKATADECLHAGLDGQLMTYYYPGCNRKSLCGESETNYKNELDPYSTRSYWKIFSTDSGSIMIQNVETKEFISIINNSVRLSKNPKLADNLTIKKAL